MIVSPPLLLTWFIPTTYIAGAAFIMWLVNKLANEVVFDFYNIELMISRLTIYSCVYAVIVIAFCIYWAINFTRHTTYKGDEFFMLVQALLAPTYLFYLTTQFFVGRINFMLLLITPLLTCVAAFCVGMIFFLVTGLGGVPRQYILVYGLLYGLISLLAAYRFWRGGPEVKE